MKPYYEHGSVEILHGDVREVLPTLPDESVHCVVTSPPYWGLRDYGVKGQLGLERTPDEYIANMVAVFREVKRVLRSDGTLWLNMGDSYASNGGHSDSSCDDRRGQYNIGARPEHSNREFGARGGKDCDPQRGGSANGQPYRATAGARLKPKDLCGIPWMLAFALRADGWYLRQDIIWSKPNPMPESVTDRCTKAHEYIFLLSKSERYYFDQEAILERCSPATHARLSQDVQAQIGSARVPGKTNGNMKAVARSKRNSFARETKESNGGHGQKPQHRSDRDDIDYSGVRNKRSVWEVTTQPFPEPHFATFPEDLIKPCILAGCPAGGTVLDPFFGSGTTGLVASKLRCKCIGIELNSAYIEIAQRRLSQEVLQF